MKNKIIAIHGVGESKHGDLIFGLSQSLGLENVRLEERIINGLVYKIGVSEKSETEIHESNWSDIQKPNKNWNGILRHIGMLCVSMFDIATNTKISFHKFLINLLRLIIEGFALGASTIYITTQIMFHVNSEEYFIKTSLSYAVLSILLIGFTFINLKGTKYSKYYQFGLLQLIPIIALLAVYLFKENFDFSQLLTYAKNYRTIVFSLMGVLWLTITPIYFYKYLKTNELKYICNLIFVTIPFILINSFGTVFTLFFSAMYESAIASENYNLKLLEIGASISYTSIGIIPIVYYIIYKFSQNSKYDFPKFESVNKKGLIAQNGMKVFIFYTIISILIFYLFIILKCRNEVNNNAHILDIYKYAIIRVFPLVTWFIGPLAIVFDVIGDVLFYINPNSNSKASVQENCKNNLKNIIEYCSTPIDSKVTIIAHSWGTVIATDVLSEIEQEGNITRKFNLLTLGSPLQSICNKFLNREIKYLKNVDNWVNAYRDGDYIAGPIKNDKVTNINIEAGGHIHYWSINFIGEMVKSFK